MYMYVRLYIVSVHVQFLTFVRVNYLTQLAEKLPASLLTLDEQWLKPPPSLQEVATCSCTYVIDTSMHSLNLVYETKQGLLQALV